ncbi:uncharacterized protein PHALS_15363 [Plasmopara halstedii]|uniref:Uncharacterized protein n=1 Tax=Plasmopara halstedii TaxID=4781 RepID=A0A0P1AEG5_PLAHL|nr:uncharacterized protein PHALS_15363 [Plasmopara halstedii]CEG39177.1 hypothetical protein PHALS_15363 [Plasmopara halstedii]|eukprot:XP_024575546.1 hypothetical protein PHALS_15363 [Plasmopara halstedii]
MSGRHAAISRLDQIRSYISCLFSLMCFLFRLDLFVKMKRYSEFLDFSNVCSCIEPIALSTAAYATALTWIAACNSAPIKDKNFITDDPAPRSRSIDIGAPITCSGIPCPSCASPSEDKVRMKRDARVRKSLSMRKSDTFRFI